MISTIISCASLEALCNALVRVCLLIIDALWSPAGKGLTSWLSFEMSNCEFVTFPLVSWVWLLIVSIPDLCPLSNFVNNCYFLFQGCYSSLEDAIKSHLGVIIGVGVGIAMVQVCIVG